ncbi:MAG: 23S rRNA (pseudouridine(1915)-N(3))-methyltransferase RlmH [Muribaculaceae bacterium]|nr:23S rRNA (pseudouridine(1915)-N(3))-methyltransferase RlmH [Muribaculaceae bacterium]
MKIVLAVVGRMNNSYLNKGVDDYAARLRHYVPFDIVHLDDAKHTRNLSEAQQKQAEGRNILAFLESSDHVVLLDEHGKMMRSVEFARYIERKMATVQRRLVFVVGGPYGFSPEVYARADGQLSLSPMTFSHEMIRLIFTEQLYRAMTILRNEPYHHE